jgi:hypothetical protein
MSAYIKDPFFKTLHSKSQQTLLTDYPTADYKSCVQYVYGNNTIRLIVKEFSGDKKVYYL